MSANPHGEWLTRGTPEWRADLEHRIGHPLPDDDERIGGRNGMPHPVIPQCTYCGSISPGDFVGACRAGYRMEVADWKYGWPHKVYVDWPNPNPNEKRITSRTYGGPDADPETGIVPGSERWGTYPTLHLKFYTEHLAGWDGLEDAADVIALRTGVRFDMREGKLVYRGKPQGLFA